MSTESSSSRRPGSAGPADSDGPTRPGLRWLRTLFGMRRNGDLRETLEELVSERAEGEGDGAAADERALLRNVLRLRDQSVGDVMVPRVDIVAIDLDCDLQTIVQTMQKAGHSRLPVYRESLDDVVGMVHIKDVVAYWEQRAAFRLERAVREVLFASPTMPVLDMLIEMRQKRVHLGLVVDEYGGVDGLITIEDLVEEIVGEIEDEFDAAEGPRLVRRP
ncbi:MAG: hemolysin family protein, partial [Alphaproteobacteria bacterium]